MSDPIANAEIEDVLSSIRRLVSAEERGERPGRPRPENREKPGARLVLTPDHRVDDAPTGDAPDAAGHEDRDDPAADAADEVEIDLPEPDDIPHAGGFDAIEDAELVEEGDEPAVAEVDRAEAGAPVDEDEASSDDDEPAWFMRHAAPDDDTPDDAARMQPDMPGPALDGTAEDADGAGEAVADAAEDFAEDEAARADLGEIGARIAEFESAVAGQPGEWEPDGAPDDGDNAADPVSPLPWDELERDAAEPDDDDVQAGSAGDANEPAGAGGWYSEESLIDEDALRDLVGEIVRQELQGALGERITRNVRKLVRREIHRALMSQGLDD